MAMPMTVAIIDSIAIMMAAVALLLALSAAAANRAVAAAVAELNALVSRSLPASHLTTEFEIEGEKPPLSQVMRTCASPDDSSSANN